MQVHTFVLQSVQDKQNPSTQLNTRKSLHLFSEDSLDPGEALMTPGDLNGLDHCYNRM